MARRGSEYWQRGKRTAGHFITRDRTYWAIRCGSIHRHPHTRAIALVLAVDEQRRKQRVGARRRDEAKDRENLHREDASVICPSTKRVAAIVKPSCKK